MVRCSHSFVEMTGDHVIKILIQQKQVFSEIAIFDTLSLQTCFSGNLDTIDLEFKLALFMCLKWLSNIIIEIRKMPMRLSALFLFGLCIYIGFVADTMSFRTVDIAATDTTINTVFDQMNWINFSLHPRHMRDSRVIS